MTEETAMTCRAAFVLTRTARDLRTSGLKDPFERHGVGETLEITRAAGHDVVDHKEASAPTVRASGKVTHYDAQVVRRAAEMQLQSEEKRCPKARQPLDDLEVRQGKRDPDDIGPQFVSQDRTV